MTYDIPNHRWVITVDHYADLMAKPGTNYNAVGMMGPRGCNPLVATPHAFRMYDDDRNLVYEGFSSRIEFDPLDDFGTPNFGCTYIEYLINGKWEII